MSAVHSIGGNGVTHFERPMPRLNREKLAKIHRHAAKTENPLSKYADDSIVGIQKERKKEMKKALKRAIEKRGFKVYGDLVEINGTLYPLPLVHGNKKIGDVWQSSSLPTAETVVSFDRDGNRYEEKGTCPSTCKDCYGTCGFYKFNSTRFILTMRTRFLREHMKEYFEILKIQIVVLKIKLLRIHVTGDFIDGEAIAYRDMLRELPEVSAWTYTKREGYWEIEELNRIDNCNVVKSIIRGKGFNYGTVPYIANLYYYLKREGKSVYICRCGIDKKQHCDNCDGCRNHEYVLFIVHSNGYDPKKDYGYDKIVKLINEQ